MARFTLLLLPIFLGLALSQYADCGDRCPFDNIKCVGEDAWCIGDVNSFSQPCNDANSICPVCNDVSLACHAGKCIKKTQGYNEECCEPGSTCRNETAQHKFCQEGFWCDSDTTGNSGLCKPVTVYAAAGEKCNENITCWGSLRCNSVLDGTCEFWYNDEHQAGKCLDDDDCPFSTYCKTDNFPGTCTTAYPNLNTPEGRQQAEGKVCEADLQCGHTMRCWRPNDIEQDSKFRPSLCEKYFQREEGARCTEMAQCKDGMYCSTNGRCTRADLSCEGDLCFSDVSCGRGMSCGCPPSTIGGGFARCHGNTQTQQAWEAKYWYDNAFKEFHECLDNNRCQLSDSDTWCAQTKCGNIIKKFPESQRRKCYGTEPLWGRRYPGAGAVAQPASLLVGLVVSLATYLFASS